MSYPVWPTTLPQVPQTNGYGEALTDNAIRSKMDIGPAKVRRRFTAVVEPLTVAFYLTQAQWITLRAFYYTTLAAALPFSWTHPSTGAAINARFVSPPSLSGNLGPYVIASLDLEVIP